jgi:methylated-DNA-[protein]-cysteine S-methyltransferase
MNNETIWYTHVASPVGELLLAASAIGLVHIGFAQERHPYKRVGEWTQNANKLTAAQKQLDQYFAGKRTTFDLPLAPQGTDFQLLVWMQLRAIPFGQTMSYGEVAKRLGNPKAMRAVGLANGRNPLPIIVPCHRVIGANGSMTGFGGGIERKQILLRLEGALPRQVALFD